MLTELQWLELRPKRDQIEAALHSLGVPLTGWCNEEPTFRPGYEPDWEQIERIATTLQTKGAKEWPPYIKKTAKVVEKAKAPKKVARAVKKK
jgi:hypothetical protein